MLSKICCYSFPLMFVSTQNVHLADETYSPLSGLLYWCSLRVEFPSQSFQKHETLTSSVKSKWKWARSRPTTSVRRKDQWTSGRTSHQLSMSGLLQRGEVKGHHGTVSGELEDRLYLHLRPPAILGWRQTLSSPSARRHSWLSAQSSQSHKVDLWSRLITPLPTERRCWEKENASTS